MAKRKAKPVAPVFKFKSIRAKRSAFNMPKLPKIGKSLKKIR